MNKYHKEIKEGLLALMCVGDYISYVRSDLISNSHTTDTKVKHTVLTYAITEILDDSITVGLYNHFMPVYFDSIHVYKGQLYIWRPPLKYYTLNDNDKIEMLIEILEAEDTKFIPHAKYGGI